MRYELAKNWKEEEVKEKARRVVRFVRRIKKDLVKSKQSNLVRFMGKKRYFVSIILKKDFKSVSLKRRKVRIGLIISFNLLNSKFKTENKEG